VEEVADATVATVILLRVVEWKGVEWVVAEWKAEVLVLLCPALMGLPSYLAGMASVIVIALKDSTVMAYSALVLITSVLKSWLLSVLLALLIG
jgi:hypothetical protein